MSTDDTRPNDRIDEGCAEIHPRDDETIPPLKDQQIKDGYYQAAHCTTVIWRKGWVRGFVKEWKKKMPDCSVDEHFRSEQREGWKIGKETGRRDEDPNNKCPRYRYREGEGSECERNISPFRMAWRLGWYNGYWGKNAGDVSIPRKGGLGCGSVFGRCAAKRYFRKFLT
ncbi:MAG: hypothetical protein OXK81_01525 [Chloroflexota bacterium]|nr:hypothetical protein [Rhodospirillaceae bacterium]MDE2815362.1 hypothetical protein [Chloroflexota bacterium]